RGSPLSLRRLERPASPRIPCRRRGAHRRCRPRFAGGRGGALSEREAEAARGRGQRQGRGGGPPPPAPPPQTPPPPPPLPPTSSAAGSSCRNEAGEALAQATSA